MIVKSQVSQILCLLQSAHILTSIGNLSNRQILTKVFLFSFLSFTLVCSTRMLNVVRKFSFFSLPIHYKKEGTVDCLIKLGQSDTLLVEIKNNQSSMFDRWTLENINAHDVRELFFFFFLLSFLLILSVSHILIFSEQRIQIARPIVSRENELETERRRERKKNGLQSGLINKYRKTRERETWRKRQKRKE